LRKDPAAYLLYPMSVLLSLQLDKRELVLQEETHMLCADIRHGITVYLSLMSSAGACGIRGPPLLSRNPLSPSDFIPYPPTRTCLSRLYSYFEAVSREHLKVEAVGQKNGSMSTS